MIEYWSAGDYSFPEDSVDFRTKIDTDLYALPKAKAAPQSLDISSDGSQFSSGVLIGDLRLPLIVVIG